MKAKTLKVKAVVKPMKAAGHAKAVVKPMKAAGHAQKTKIRKDVLDGKKRRMQLPPAMKARAAIVPRPWTEGAPTQRELILRSACEEQIDEMNKLRARILQLEGLVSRYDIVLRRYGISLLD